MADTLAQTMGLVDRFPALNADTLVQRFVPPPRFASATFANYSPNPEFSSQSSAREDLERFAQTINSTSERPRTSWNPFKKSHAPKSRPGVYLDGGFGVGKTHLLTALWFEASGAKAYMSFEELTAFIGFAGMDKAVATFRNHRLLCIDEFELDDVANTLMVVSFLRGLLEDGPPTHLATTSNTIPGSLGEQRFSASEFRREIASIADHFTELRIDGPDYRVDHAASPLTLRQFEAMDSSAESVGFEALLEHLSRVHPVQYSALFDNVAHVTIDGLRTINEQDVALLFVQFVDKAYDAHIPVRFNGCATEEIFATRYRSGGYRKKYGRAESRINAMRSESQ